MARKKISRRTVHRHSYTVMKDIDLLRHLDQRLDEGRMEDAHLERVGHLPITRQYIIRMLETFDEVYAYRDMTVAELKRDLALLGENVRAIALACNHTSATQLRREELISWYEDVMGL